METRGRTFIGKMEPVHKVKTRDLLCRVDLVRWVYLVLETPILSFSSV